MDLNQVKKIKIPSSPGCYQFLDKKGKIIYVGKAANLKSRVLSYWRASANHSPVKKEMMKQIAGIKIIETDSEIEALLLEANLIKKYYPAFNIVMRDDKRHVYIKISLADEIPGVFITRKVDKNGKYFGPFVSTDAVKQTLKAIRKIWPYCEKRKIPGSAAFVPRASGRGELTEVPAPNCKGGEINPPNPLYTKGVLRKPCFYYQINRCLGICGGIIGREEYMKKVIKPIILFLEGKKGRVITNYELRIKNLKNRIEKLKTKKERLSAEKEKNNLEFQLKNIKQVLENARVLGVAEKYASDAIELAKILNLKNIPKRIEGYDIANTFGREATGSMVVFSHGEPDKNEYRKFKIKTDNKANDTGMLKEVLGRRLRHLAEITNDKLQITNKKRRMAAGKEKLKIKERWPLPNLIIIDGGKGQLNTCLSVLKKNKLDIEVVAISKGEGLRSARAQDKIFFPGEKKPLELPLASPALHLIKRVRDEAHRFAIGYHKNLRRKKFFK